MGVFGLGDLLVWNNGQVGRISRVIMFKESDI